MAKQFCWLRLQPIAQAFFSRDKSVFTRTPVLDSFGWFLLMSASQSNGTGLQFEGLQPMQAMPIHVLLPIDQLWHHYHLQQVCWFSFNLAIFDQLEQELFLKAAAFFLQQRPQ